VLISKTVLLGLTARQQLSLAATCQIIVAGAIIPLFLRSHSATMTGNA
jgi:hypothetical protein